MMHSFKNFGVCNQWLYQRALLQGQSLKSELGAKLLLATFIPNISG